ncbi:DUF4123 domain-containing protein [uncultured Tateyamaria sp.]|uniref:DUF4123 domain-containing protein n=1 Tax=uncultured Tateyamaria sp. TaxID=455651 RepID=UPI0026168E4B|nr:DUF4123 domain-containing protein [uncultured Tateyamaria sp.]
MLTWLATLEVKDADVPDDAAARRYSCPAAVWAESRETAIERVALFLKVTPYALVSVTDCTPAGEEAEQAHAELAALVHDTHLVEFGDLTEIGTGHVPEPMTQPQSLKEAVLALDHVARPVYAVLDGAQFDDLPAALFDGGFVTRPLYLNVQDRSAAPVRTSPYLVTLDEAGASFAGRSYGETVEALFALLGDKPAGVFWQCEAGTDALYFHLRKTNRILIPKTFLSGNATDAEPDEPHAFVLFRHADANSLAQTVFAMNSEEASRLFGPCTALLFGPSPDWTGDYPWFHLVRPYSWPAPRPGALTLSTATMEKIEERRRDRLILKTVAYLRKVLPPNFQHLSRTQLTGLARASRKSGKALGLRGLGAHNRWAYLCAITEGRIAKSREVKAFIKRGNDTPDEQVKIAMKDTLATMKNAVAELQA